LVDEEDRLEIVDDEGDPRVDEATETLVERSVRGRVRDPLVHQPIAPLEETQGERVLRVEELVERRVRVPGLVADLADRGLAEAVAHEELERAREDLLLADRVARIDPRLHSEVVSIC